MKDDVFDEKTTDRMGLVLIDVSHLSHQPGQLKDPGSDKARLVNQCRVCEEDGRYGCSLCRRGGLGHSHSDPPSLQQQCLYGGGPGSEKRLPEKTLIVPTTWTVTW
jgi:hypothetical protein